MQKSQIINFWKKNWLLICLVAITIVVFSPISKAELLNWDDDKQITNNQDIRNLSWPGITKIFSSYYVGMYQPLATLSYALEYKLFGINSQVIHLDNLIIHCLNILLVYYFSWLLFKDKKMAWWSAAVFAVWPTQAEVVAWASTRSTLLTSFFTIGTLICYLKYLKNKKFGLLAASYLLAILAMLTKSAAVIIPMLMLLIDYFLNRPLVNKKVLLEKIPLLILSVIIILITLDSRSSSGILNNSVFFGLSKLVLLSWSFLWQIRLAILPVKLNFFYVQPIDNSNIPFTYVWLGLIIIPLLVLFVFKYRKNKQLLLVAGWFSLLIIPSIQILPHSNQIAADRYNYLAILSLAWGLYLLAKKSYLTNKVKLFIIIIILGSAAGYTYQLTKHWLNSHNLWFSSYNSNPGGAMSTYYYGGLLIEDGDFASGSEIIEKVLMQNPYFAPGYNALGYKFLQTGQLQTALNYFNQAVIINGDIATFQFNRALALNKLGRYKQASLAFKRAELLATTHPDYYYLLPDIEAMAGLNNFQAGEFGKAIGNFDKSYQLKKQDQTLFLLGMALAKNKQADEGCPKMKLVVKQRPMADQKIFKQLCPKF